MQTQSPGLSLRAIVAVAIGAAILLLLAMDRHVGLYDESIILQGAVEVLHGAVPHRDFYFNYGPGQLWVVAGLFKTFGVSFTVTRLYDVAVKCLIIAGCGLCLRALKVPSRLALLALLTETCVFALNPSPLYSVFPVLLLAIAGTLLLCGEPGGVRSSAARLIGAGACAGAIALFRYDCGAYVVIGQVGAMAWIGRRDGASWTLLAQRVLVYGAGVALVFVPVAVVALHAGVFPGFKHDILDFARTVYPQMRNLPWPRPERNWMSVSDMAVYLPPLIALAGVAVVVREGPGAARGKAAGDPSLLIAMLSLLTAMLFLKALVRTSTTHAVMALALSVPLALGVHSHARDRLLRRAGLGLAFGILVLSWAGLTGLGRNWPVDFRENALAFASGKPRPERPSNSCILPRVGIGTMEPDRYEAACYLAAHTGPEEPVFVGAGRHDRLFVNDMSIYFASGRRPVTRWYHFDPGLQTAAPVQREIIAELEHNRVRYAVQDATFDTHNEPNGSAISSGVVDLDRYLAAHFVPVRRFGKLTVLLRRE